MSRSRSYYNELLRDLQDPVEAQGYLNAVLEENDPELLQLALQHVVEARLRMTDSADPETNALYQTLLEGNQPDLICFNRVLSLLGCRLAIQPQDKDEVQRTLANLEQAIETSLIESGLDEQSLSQVLDL